MGNNFWLVDTFGLIGGSIIPAPRCILFFGRVGGSIIPAPLVKCVSVDDAALATLAVLEMVTVENVDKASKDKAII